MSRVVVFCAEYPVLSETFVWREVESLKHSGLEVKVAALRHASKPAVQVSPANWVLFQNGIVSILVASIKALLLHPGSALKTLGFAFKTAFTSNATFKDKLKILFQGICAIGFAESIEKFKPEWLHCHFAHAPATYTMFVAKFLNVPWSFTGHANDLFQRRILLKEKLINASKIACISKWHQEYYLNFVPGIENKLKIVRCGVAMNENSVGRSTSVFSIISVGRLIEKKGFHILLEACQELVHINESINIDIVGDGPDKNKLEQLAVTLPNNINVKFHGPLPHNEILTLLVSADLFVMPCIDDENGDRDGIPVSMMEAMAAGVPVLAGDLPAIRELITDEITGWIKASTPEEIKKTLLHILENKLTTKEIGQNARRWVQEEFSTSVNTDRLIKMISGDVQ